jgi:hypothetical protein
VRRHDHNDDRRVKEAIDRLWDQVPAPSADELDSIAESAAGHERAPVARSPRRRRVRIGVALAIAAVALALGSGLGFGLGSSLTPSGSATSFVGFGFLPAQGWNVLQSGTLDGSGVARALAANVALDSGIDLSEDPSATTRSLPPRGVLITATFRPRGNAGVDARFPVRKPPLRLEDAERVSGGRSELRAAIRGYNVALEIHFGSAEPSARMRAAAQRQLDRLIVAAEQVTIFARPTILDSTNRRTTTLFGSIESGRAGELVTIQARDCGSTFFRVVDGATTTSGGSWTTQYTPGINTLLRAVWDGKASNQIAIRQRVWVGLRQRSRSLFTVGAGAPPRGGMVGGQEANFGGKSLLFQRLDRRLGRWVTVKRVRLDRSQPFNTEFRATLPRATVVRAVLPRSEARPCYLGGVSFRLRT